MGIQLECENHPVLSIIWESLSDADKQRAELLWECKQKAKEPAAMQYALD